MKRYLGAVLPALLSVILFGVTVFGFLLPEVESQIVAKKREMIRELTNTVWNILATYDAQVRGGLLDKDEAQRRALGRIRALRYGPEGKDYFWVNDLNEVMIMHPYRADLEGQRLPQFKDIKGKDLLHAFVDVARQHGEGFVSYHWQWKDEPGPLKEKTSYIKLFQPWGWVVGTGLYKDDVEAEMRAMNRDMSLAGAAVLLLVTLLSGYLTYREVRAEGERRAAQDALRQTLDKYRAVLEASPDPVIVYNYVGLVDYVNPAFSRVFGWRADEVLGGKIDFVPDDEKEATLAAINAVYDHPDGLLSFESRRRTRDGRTRNVMVSLAVYRGDGGAPLGMVVNLTDITSMKRSAEALRESEEKFRSISANALDGVVMIDPQGRITFWNQAATAIFGYAADEVLGRELHPLLAPPRYHADYVKAFAEFGDKGTGKAVGRMLELVARRKNGQEFPAELSISSLQLRGQWYAVGIVRDITERKQADEDLRQSESRYRTILETVPYSIAISDLRDGANLEVNDGFCLLSGHSRQEALGKTALELNLYNRPEDHLLLRERLERDGEITGLPVTYRAKDGRPLECLLSVRRFVYAGRPCLLSVAQDVSALRQAEREQARLQAQLQRAQRMEAIGTLAGGVAHDFNNILQAIGGYTQLIGGHPGLDQKVRRYAEDIDLAARRATDLVKRLLTFSRKVEPELQRVDLNRQIGHAVAMLERTIPKMVRITTRLDPELKAVKADPGQMEQVLMNLGTNARDAMPEGGELLIETQNVRAADLSPGAVCQLAADEYVMLRVSDSGMGMDAETQKKIFDPFFTTKGVGQGTGLGLSIVYGIIEGHGGRISCYSQPGQGTVFEICLPVADESLTEREAPEVVTLRQAQGNGETILVVDDEAAILDVSTELLQGAGYKVITARSGEEALEAYRTRGQIISLVIMDLGMPGMGGQRALQELKRLNPEVKVLISSGYSGDGPVKDSLAAGALGFIMKPYRLSDLLEKAHAAIQG